MKIDWDVMLAVLIALIVYGVLDKLFLEKMLSKVGGLLDED